MVVKVTEPHRARNRPIRLLRAEVVEGPDAGRATTARKGTLAVGTAADNDLVLTDTTVSRYHVDLAPADDGVLVVDHRSTNGVAVGPVRIERAVVSPGTVLALGRSRLRVSDGGEGEMELHDRDQLAGLVGRSTAMRQLFAQLARSAQSDAPVLIAGEGGTGKESAARALHEIGPRRQGPFVVVDCGGLAPALVAADLFGATPTAGDASKATAASAFQRARGGTLVLHEVGDLPAELQNTLITVLDRRKLRQPGRRQDTLLDIRLVATSRSDLRALVNSQGFRHDLYLRLAVVTLTVPPLRERSGDIPLLVETFLKAYGHEDAMDALFPAAVLDQLALHAWPGNVRELRNLVEASVTLGEATQPFAGAAFAAGASAVSGSAYRVARAGILWEFEARYLAEIMRRAGGNVSQASRLAEMDRSHLIVLLRRHGLRR